jgi:hypothetical protein
MKYIAPRNMTVSSISGRSVEFKRGEPTYAPPQMHAELIERGIVPAEAMPEEPEVPGVKEPTLLQEREAALFAAFEKIALRGKRTDFTAVGIPHNAVLVKELGWNDLNAKERDAAWAKWQLERSEK